MAIPCHQHSGKVEPQSRPQPSAPRLGGPVLRLLRDRSPQPGCNVRVGELLRSRERGVLSTGEVMEP